MMCQRWRVLFFQVVVQMLLYVAACRTEYNQLLKMKFISGFRRDVTLKTQQETQIKRFMVILDVLE